MILYMPLQKRHKYIFICLKGVFSIMGKRFAIMICALLLLMSCSKRHANLPSPPELYAVISESIELPEMVEFPQDELSEYIGIEPDEYLSAVSFSCLDALRPDEIIIVQAINENAAAEVYKKLKARLEYKRKSAINYLPENIPIIDKAVIRQDGLTVSMLVSDNIDDIIKIYNSQR